MPIVWSQSPINWQAPLNQGLVGWWLVLPGIAGGTTWRNLTGRYDGTLTAMAPSSTVTGWNSTRRVGGWGEVRLQGGTAQYITVPAFPALDLAPAFSISLWGRQVALDVIGYLVSKYIATNSQIALETYNDGNIYFEVNGATNGLLQLDYSTVISAGTWFHLVVVYNGAGATNALKAQLYVNGRVPAGITYSGTLPATTSDLTGGPLWFGRFGNGSSTFNGALDDIHIWNRPLTAPEARAVYLAGLQRYPQELNWHRAPVWGLAAEGFALDEDPWLYQFQEVA